LKHRSDPGEPRGEPIVEGDRLLRLAGGLRQPPRRPDLPLVSATAPISQI
jgi:hypothetical protein